MDACASQLTLENVFYDCMFLFWFEQARACEAYWTLVTLGLVYARLNGASHLRRLTSNSPLKVLLVGSSFNFAELEVN